MNLFRICRQGLMVNLFAGLIAFGQVASVQAAARDLPDFSDLVEKTGPSVVNIRTTEKVRSNGGMPGFPGGQSDEEMQEFFRRFFGVPMPSPNDPGNRGQSPRRNEKRPSQPQPGQEEEQPRGVGSGFVITSDGYVMTNAHVVDGADEIYVTLTDKKEFKAKLVGFDKRTDVALVKIDAKDLPKVTLGDVSKLKVGEWVLAIGSPFGLENTVTAGIVSAKARDTGEYLPFIQTDVAVNPGNSGGPLINTRGEVVGINSQIYSRSGGYMGISFAIPIDEAMRVADQLKASGKVVRGRIGVSIAEVTKDVAEPLGLSKPQGALVRMVEAASPAEKAGVEAGDIILKFNGVAIDKASDLPRLVGNTKPTSKVPMQVWRKGASRELTVTVAEMEAEKLIQTSDKKPKQPNAEATPPNALGLVVSELTDAQKSELRVKGGVLVESVEGSASRVGLRQGDIVLSLNNVDITSAKQFDQMVAKLEKGKNAVLLVRRGDSAQFVPIKPTGN